MILEASAKTNMKRVSLELGGKSPLVIFDDVDGISSMHFMKYLIIYSIQ